MQRSLSFFCRVSEKKSATVCQSVYLLSLQKTSLFYCTHFDQHCKVSSKNRTGLTLNCHHSCQRQSCLPKDEKNLMAYVTILNLGSGVKYNITRQLHWAIGLELQLQRCFRSVVMGLLFSGLEGKIQLLYNQTKRSENITQMALALMAGWAWNTSRSAKCHRRAAVGHWISLYVCSVVVWLIVYQFGILSLSCSQYSQTICLSG